MALPSAYVDVDIMTTQSSPAIFGRSKLGREELDLLAASTFAKVLLFPA